MNNLLKYLLIIFLPLGIAFANAGKHGPKHHGHKMEELNLTPEQKKQMEEIRSKSKPEMKALHEKMKAIHEKMTTAFQAAASDEELTKIHKEMQSLHNEMGDKMFQKKLAISKILTPEQRKKFKFHGMKRPGRHHMMDGEDDEI